MYYHTPKRMTAPILPPATIGILGSGQLGRMLALAARQMGYRVHVLSPGHDTPTGQVADKEITADYGDLAAVRTFAQGVDVVTYEFENVPVETAVTCAQFAPLRPGIPALHIAQNRQREKQFLLTHGLPTTPFVTVQSLDNLLIGLETIGPPAILKTATSGYDGKGQHRITTTSPHPHAPATAAWNAIGQQPAILEKLVEFERELSVVAARDQGGTFVHYGLIENSHINHILDTSHAPADVPPALVQEATQLTQTIMQKLDVIGVLCVEFFLTSQGKLLINEIAPRPHNSGHLTIEACLTSQFEQQLRAICGLPLGNPTFLRPAAMVNLLGDLWVTPDKKPDWTAVLTDPRLKLHLYGKQTPRPGRKMGHLTALANTGAEAANLVREARNQLPRD